MTENEAVLWQCGALVAVTLATLVVVKDVRDCARLCLANLALWCVVQTVGWGLGGYAWLYGWVS